MPSMRATHDLPSSIATAAERAGISPAGLDAWRAFLVAHAHVTRRLDDDLRRAHGISISEYDALVQLAHAESRTLRMNVLADRVLLSKSGLTRLVDRLVDDGLVERTHCESDARGTFAVLTERGLELLRRASATHLRGVRDYFVDALEPRSLDALAGALGAVVGRTSALEG